MPANIEIKAKIVDEKHAEKVGKIAEKLSGKTGTKFTQKDIFYKVPSGRLKLRILQDEPAQLIFYDRENRAGPKRSDFRIATVTNADEIHDVLGKALQVRGTVKKERTLHQVGQTRVHLDRVEGLGHFIELEVLLRVDQSDEDGTNVANDLMAELDVQAADFIDVAYVDLLLDQ